MRAWSLNGNSQRLDGGAMFGNAPKALWSRWITPDETNRIPLACRCLLIEESNGRKVLLETGIGAFFPPKLRQRYGVNETHHVLLHNLAAVGCKPEDIDVIVLSHLHFDHAGGLLSEWVEDSPHTLAFPSAHYVVGESAWARACEPHPRDKASFIPELHTLLLNSKRLEVVPQGHTSQILGGRYTFRISNGHTPGQLHTVIKGTDHPLIFCGDLIPGTPWVHLPITMGYDRNPELLIEEKADLLNWAIEHQVRLFYTHDSHTALSHVCIDDRGRYQPDQMMTSLNGITL